MIDLALALAQHWKLLIGGTTLVGLVAVAVSFVLPENYSSRTLFLPPQQQQSSAASALSQLGALSNLAGLAGAAAAIKSPAEQYVALLQSSTVADRLIDDFNLMQVYDVDYRDQARERLARKVQISLGRKDGLIAVEVEDQSADRAAAMANRFVEELRRLTSQLAVTEAQQRRVFFETQLVRTRERLTAAQQSLQATGFSQGALRADARASAEAYARLKAEATATEVRLQALRRMLADNAPEVQQALSTLGAQRAQLSKLEESGELAVGPDYISKFREFKYQETLFDLFARQYELARVDESREGALIQVVDYAKPAERRSWPKRGWIASVSALAAFVLLTIFAIVRRSWLEAASLPENASKVAELRSALGKR